MGRKFKCKHCGEFKEESIKLPVGRFCCYEHAAEWARDKAECDFMRKMNKEAKKKEKSDRMAHRERKQKLKPKSKILSEAQSAFNAYIRVRDYYKPCISCGKPREQVEREQGWKTGGCWDAGHFMTRGAKGQLRFVLYNVHKQCKSCNAGGGKFSHKAATVDTKYRENLIEKIGIDKVESLENNNEIDTKKNDVEYLERIKNIFNRRARWYKKRRDLT